MQPWKPARPITRRSSSSCGPIANRERRWRSRHSRPAARPEGRQACLSGHDLIAMSARLRQATELDLPRISEVRHGTAENRFEDSGLVNTCQLGRYLNEANFLVSQDHPG